MTTILANECARHRLPSVSFDRIVPAAEKPGVDDAI